MFAPLVEEYCEQFRQVASLTFDLGPYLYYLDDFTRQEKSEEKSKLLQSFTDAWEKQTDASRRVRIYLNQVKLEMILGKATHQSTTSDLVHRLQNEYFEAIFLDGKPEKGERKLADDFILMINELLD